MIEKTIYMHPRPVIDWVAQSHLECECCGRKGAWPVVACAAVPYSTAICWTCIVYNAQPQGIVDYMIDEVGHDLADWYLDGEYIWSLEEGYETVRKYRDRRWHGVA